MSLPCNNKYICDKLVITNEPVICADPEYGNPPPDKLYDDVKANEDVPNNEPVRLGIFVLPVTVKLPLIIAEPVYGNGDT